MANSGLLQILIDTTQVFEHSENDITIQQLLNVLVGDGPTALAFS
jgi:hypothetical protein